MRRQLISGLISIWLCHVFVASVQADAVGEARVHYERAIKFYDDAVYDAALVEFTRAYELNPSYRIVYNIAQARLAMRDYAAAIEAYQRYLREGGGQVANDRVAAVRAQLNDLQQRVGKLTIETDVADSEVLVDDVAVGMAPLTAAVVVNAGVRRVTVRHPDHAPRSQRVSVAGGEQLRVSLLLRPRQPEAAAQREAPAPLPPPAADVPTPAQTAMASEPSVQPTPRSSSPDRVPAYVATGVTVALAATAVVLGVVALNKSNDLATLRDKPQIDEALFDDERSKMNTLARVADGFGIAALVGAGFSTWLWLKDSGSREHANLHVGLGSAQLRGEF